MKLLIAFVVVVLLLMNEVYVDKKLEQRNACLEKLVLKWELYDPGSFAGTPENTCQDIK